MTVSKRRFSGRSVAESTTGAGMCCARTGNATYPTHVSKFENGIAKVWWQINPDGRYFMDEDGYGMTDDEEIELVGAIDRTGKVVVKYTISK